ncbi:unnamed protein product [Symbiodinium sp. CCMP2592]|nr:unnamed protein product [Symbiodinium sp. CCMP2592]
MLGQAGDAELLLLREQLAEERERSQPSAERADMGRNVRLRKISWSTNRVLLEFCAVQIYLSWCGCACREAAEDESGAPAVEKLLQDEVKQQGMELDRLRAEVRSCQQQIQAEQNVSNDLREQLQTQQAGDAELLLLREQLAEERERREALENSKAAEDQSGAPAVEKLLQDEVKQQGMELDRLRAEVRSCQQQIQAEQNVSNDLREQLQTQQAGDAELLLLREQLAEERERREALENSKAQLVTSPAEHDTPLLISRQVSDASDIHQTAPEAPTAESNQPSAIQRGTPEPEQQEQPEASLSPTKLEATKPGSGTSGVDENETAEHAGGLTQQPESSAHEEEPPAAPPGVDPPGSQGEDKLQYIEQSAAERQPPQPQQESWPSQDQEQKRREDMSHACVGPMPLWHMSNICRSAQATASRKTLPETPEVSGCRVGSCKTCPMSVPPTQQVVQTSRGHGFVNCAPDRRIAFRYLWTSGVELWKRGR